MLSDLSKIRNIGISAHIDSGKTTLTERILYYTKRIHAIHEVKGKDGVGATMDSMDLERERGITIQSAATACTWAGLHINIIDTPGHVDFTIEVERSLRVLDGAILVLCGVAGVQSQSLTVDRQMRRYKVPRIAFVNKLDRTGANPFKATKQLREILAHNAVMIQLPIGLEDKLEGLVDLVNMEAVTFHGPNGDEIRKGPIPANMEADAQQYREIMLDAVSMFSDELMEAMLEERVTPELIRAAIRKGTISLQLTPVMMGSAYKNKGVQLLLDGVVNYLPNPTEVTNEAHDQRNNEAKVILESKIEGKPLVMLAFKLVDDRYGQLTYLRVYQGALRRDDTIYNQRTGKKQRVGRLVRMHSDDMEEITASGAGDIVAMFGVDCASGDTFTDGSVDLTMTSMFVPDPVISLSIRAKDKKAEVNIGKALNRFSKEDPTFRVFSDPESNETIIAGMGELHLEVYIERMKREYAAEVETSPPRVAYRETITQQAKFDYTHKKQTGGSGQYGKVGGFVEPVEEGEQFQFVDETVGGIIPRNFIPAIEKGFKSMMEKGALIGHQIVNVKIVLNDGGWHAVDSNEMAFQEAARGAWRAVYEKARPKILEPIMKVEIEGPAEFAGNILTTLMQRRGIVIGSTEEFGQAKVTAEVPLAEMFGYSTTLRSGTQGKAEFSMEFAKYREVPENIAQDLMEKAKAKKEAERK